MATIYCGIDFHKRTSTLHVINSNGEAIKKECITIQTDRLVSYLSNRKGWRIGIEASGGVNHICERLLEEGHDVRLLDPKKLSVLNFSKTKTDEKDAAMIAEALRLEIGAGVHIKGRFCRELKSLLVSREMIMRTRMNYTNHIRGVLREYGFVLNKGKETFFIHARAKINEVENVFLREQLFFMMEEAERLEARERELLVEIEKFLSDHDLLKRLQTIPGIGFLTAAAMIAVIENVSRFKNAKDFASYLGLTPREFSSGDKRRMGSITRSGPEMLRRYLIHGARAVLRYGDSKSADKNVVWAMRVKSRQGMNKAIVALAHRMSRIAYAVIRDGGEYRKKASLDKQEKVA